MPSRDPVLRDDRPKGWCEILPRRVLLLYVVLGCLLGIGTAACHRQSVKGTGGSSPREKVPGHDNNPGSKGKPALPDFAVNTASRRDGEATWYNVPENSLPERRAWVREMTAASDVLPMGTYVRVHRLEGSSTDKSVIVRITDDGVHQKGTLVDLNKEAAEALGMLKAGKVRIRLEVLVLKNADTDKPVDSKNAPTRPKLDVPAATKDDEKQASKSKAGT